MHTNNESTIEIERTNGKITSVKLVLPVWVKQEDNLLYADIPMLNLQTYGSDEADLEIGIHEVVKGFIIISEKFGSGFESELLALRWAKVDNETNANQAHYDFFVNEPVLQTIVNTGESKLLSYELA